MSAPRFMVVTDVDGTLLDSDFGWAAAVPALETLARAGIPLVLCSSRTRTELAALARALGLRAPFIVENGGAVVVPKGAFAHGVPLARDEGEFLVLPLGIGRPQLLSALKEIAAEVGVKVRGFAGLTPLALKRLTGLSRREAERALEREFDEPFLIDGYGRPEAVIRCARAHGLRIRRGGRFFHLAGGSDKGRAVRVLVGLYEADGVHVRTLGLGDAETDLPMLLAVDEPIVMPRSDGSLDPTLAAELPRARLAPAPGPAGWRDAVLGFLRRRVPVGAV